MNTTELANHFEKMLLMSPELVGDDWDRGWNAAIHKAVELMRAQETN